MISTRRDFYYEFKRKKIVLSFCNNKYTIFQILRLIFYFQEELRYNNFKIDIKRNGTFQVVDLIDKELSDSSVSTDKLYLNSYGKYSIFKKN